MDCTKFSKILGTNIVAIVEGKIHRKFRWKKWLLASRRWSKENQKIPRKGQKLKVSPYHCTCTDTWIFHEDLFLWNFTRLLSENIGKFRWIFAENIYKFGVKVYFLVDSGKLQADDLLKADQPVRDGNYNPVFCRHVHSCRHTTTR